MWIPIQPDGVTLRRLPLATFTLLGMITAGLILSNAIPISSLRRPLQDLVRFGADHKYLDLSPEVQSLVAANRHTVNVFPQPAGSEKARRIEQKQLDQLTSAFFAKWHSHARYMLGFRVPPSPISWLTYAFLGGSVLLGLWNMLFLYVCATPIEDRWGRIPFCIFILLSILTGAIGHLLHHRTGAMPLLGAGSMVAGVLGAFAVVFDEHRVPIKPLISREDREVLVPAWSIFLCWLAGCGILIILTRGSLKLGGPSWASLIYAFCFGLGSASVIRGFKLEKTLYRSPFDRLEKDQQFLVQIDRELRVGSPQKAFEIMQEACKGYPDRLDFLQPCWDQAHRLGQTHTVPNIGKTLLQHYMQAGETESASYLLEEMRACQQPILFPASQLVDWGQQFISVGSGRQAALLLEHLMWPDTQDLPALETLLHIAVDGDPKTASSQVSKKLGQPDLPEIVRQTFMTWRGRLGSAGSDETDTPEPIEIVAHSDPLDDADPFAATYITRLAVTQAQPVALHKGAIGIRLRSGEVKRLAAAKVQGLACAQIRGLSGVQTWILDLHLDHPWHEQSQHRVVRFRSDHLSDQDPLGQRLTKGEAVFKKLGRWLSTEQTLILPESGLFDSEALPVFPSVAEYEQEVYGTQSAGTQ